MRDPRVLGSVGLAGGALVGSAASLLALPIITKIYEPTTYAQFALVFALSGTLVTVVTGRYDMACVVLPHTDSGEAEAWKVARLAVRVVLALSVLSAVLVAVALAAGGGRSSLGVVGLLVTPPLLLFMGLGTIQGAIDTRMANYRLLALRNMFQTLVIPGGQILMGLTLGPSALSLLIPLLVSSLFGVGRLIVVLPKLPRTCATSYRGLARRHNRYPKYQVPAALANNLSVSVFTYTLAFAYGNAAVGLYAVAARFVMFPSTLVIGPVNTVYFREAGRLSSDRENSLRLYRITLGGLLLVGVSGFAILAFLIDPMVRLLGPEWVGVGAMILATIPAGLAAFAGSPANSALISFGQQRQLLVWRLALVVLSPIAIISVGRLGWSAPSALALASWILLFLTLAYSAWGARVIRRAKLPSDLTSE